MPFDILKATGFLMAGNGLSLGFTQWLITSHVLFVAPPLSSQEISLYSAETGHLGTETVQLYGCQKVECGDFIVTKMFHWLILWTWLYRTQLDKLQQIHMMWINYLNTLQHIIQRLLHHYQHKYVHACTYACGNLCVCVCVCAFQFKNNVNILLNAFVALVKLFWFEAAVQML